MLAAGEITAPSREHVFERGEELEDMFRNSPQRLWQLSKARAKVFLHRKPGKYLAALGHVGDSETGPLMGIQASYVLVFPKNAAVANGFQSQNGAHEGSFSNAVSTEDTCNLSLYGLNIDAA